MNRIISAVEETTNSELLSVKDVLFDNEGVFYHSLKAVYDYCKNQSYSSPEMKESLLYLEEFAKSLAKVKNDKKLEMILEDINNCHHKCDIPVSLIKNKLDEYSGKIKNKRGLHYLKYIISKQPEPVTYFALEHNKSTTDKNYDAEQINMIINYQFTNKSIEKCDEKTLNDIKNRINILIEKIANLEGLCLDVSDLKEKYIKELNSLKKYYAEVAVKGNIKYFEELIDTSKTAVKKCIKRFLAELKSIDEVIHNEINNNLKMCKYTISFNKSPLY